MRRIYLMVVILTILSLFLINIRNNEKQDWKAFIETHPYNQPPSLLEIESVPKRDRPDLAMQQNYLMTVDLNTQTVPTGRLVEAFNQIKAKKGRFGKAAIPGVSWVEMGPNNIGGRTRAVMWDPNDANTEKLWAAGVAGGIWFNNDITDVNSSWQNVDDFMSNLAVTTMAYDPTNTQVFYAGTGEGFGNGDAVRGAGIFKSTNGGTSWSLLSATDNGNFSYVQKVIVTQAGTVLAATRAVGGTSGVYRSTDDGVTFTRMTDVPGVNIADLEEAANGDIYLGTLSSGEIYRSTNDGINWTDITPPNTASGRIELAVGSEGTTTATTVVYALGEANSNVGFFRKTVDGGANWTSVEIPSYREQNCTEGAQDFTRGQAWYDLILAVKPGDDDVVIGGGINVIKSSDGGTNFAEVSYWTGSDTQTTCDDYVHADIHAIVFRPGFPDEAIIGSDGGISYSADIGSAGNPSFNTHNKDYNVTQFYAVAAQNTSGVNYFLAGAQDNGTQQFTDAGGLSTDEVTGGDGSFCFIDQDDNNFQISSFIRNVYFLLDGSGNFVQELVDDQSSGRFINPADYDNTANILYSAGNSNQLKRISGITTTPNTQETLSVSIDGGQISAIRADANTANRIFVGTGIGDGNVYRIDDANSATPTVTNITSNITSTGNNVSSIDIGSSDDELIVTYSNFGATSVWYTNDGGTNWINKDNDGSLPDMPVRWALFNPNNTQQVMLATELGVWSTNNITDADPAWEQSSSNLANVRCDMLQYREADRLVVVATHGRGVFTTTAFSGSDENPPQVSSLSPSDNANDIRLDVDLTTTLNEAVNIETGNITIEEVEGGATFEVIDVTSGQVTLTNSNRTISINPTSDFQPLTEYRVVVDANSFSDDFSNLFEGISGDSWTFTTFDGDEPPVVSSPIPDQNALVNTSPIIIDLSSHFNDPDGDPLTYEVITNTNEALISTAISGSNLTVTIAADDGGSGELTVEATSNSKRISDVFSVLVSFSDLFEQTGSVAGTTPSQVFTDISNSEIESADNFTVTSSGGNSWYVESISVEGSNNGNAPTEAIFRVYNDNSGLPGDLFYESETISVVPTNDASDFLLTLDERLELPAGNYWLSVLSVQSFSPGNSQWFWQYSTSVEDFARRDPDQLLSGTIGSDFELSGNDGDLIFSIQGTEGISGPSGLELSETDGMVQLSWVDNALTETKYVIERSIGDASAFAPLVELAADEVSYTDETSPSNETVFYRIYAVDASDNSSGDASDNILTVPNTPTLLDVTDATSMEFTINWEVNDGATTFILDVSESEDFATFLDGYENRVLTGFSTIVDNLQSGTYYFRIAASNNAGQSTFSGIETIALEPLSTFTEELDVYPNPVTRFLQVERINPNMVVELYELSGMKVPVRSQNSSQEFILDMGELANGTYLLVIRTDDRSLTKTIIKR